MLSITSKINCQLCRFTSMAGETTSKKVPKSTGLMTVIIFVTSCILFSCEGVAASWAS